MRFFIVLITLGLCLAACGDDPEPVAGKAPPAPAATAPAGTPLPDTAGGTLHAGTTYATRRFSPAIRITPAPGKWAAEIGEQATNFDLALRGIDGQAILAFYRADRVFDPVKGGRTPADMVPAPDDFAAWLRHHPHLETSRPVRVKRLGLEGVRIDIRAVSHPERVPDECGRHAGRCVPMLYDGTDMIFYTYGTYESRVRFYVLELDGGKQLIIEEYFENPSDVKAHRGTLERTLANATMA